MSRRRDQRLADVVIELDDPAELFAVDARGLLDGSRADRQRHRRTYRAVAGAAEATQRSEHRAGHRRRMPR